VIRDRSSSSAVGCMHGIERRRGGRMREAGGETRSRTGRTLRKARLMTRGEAGPHLRRERRKHAGFCGSCWWGLVK